MSRNKQEKFSEFPSFANAHVFPRELRGAWRAAAFHNANPLVVELAAGHGVFVCSMAQRHPAANFIGIDIKSARLWAGARQALAASIANVHFVRADIAHLGDYFAPGEISELWITFPDPFPRARQAKKRLTAPRFLKTYHALLAPGGMLHLKTDSRALFEYSLQTIEDAGQWQLRTLFDNVHADPARAEAHDLDIISRYEQAHLQLGKTIMYAAWQHKAIGGGTQ